jgi:hypothetical protein
MNDDRESVPAAAGEGTAPDRVPGDPGGHDDSGRIEDLRATSDSIREDIDRLTALEDEKDGLDPADPRMDAVSTEAVEIADRIQREARMERELSRELR